MSHWTTSGSSSSPSSANSTCSEYSLVRSVQSGGWFIPSTHTLQRRRGCGIDVSKARGSGTCRPVLENRALSRGKCFTDFPREACFCVKKKILESHVFLKKINKMNLDQITSFILNAGWTFDWLKSPHTGEWEENLSEKKKLQMLH